MLGYQIFQGDQIAVEISFWFYAKYSQIAGDS